MTRYFFNITNGTVVTDHDGTEFADLGEARQAAVKLFCSIVADDPSLVLKRSDFSIEVTDERGLVMFLVQMLTVSSPAAKGAGAG